MDDLDLVEKWILDCQSNHTGICHSVIDPRRLIELPRDIIFINVQQDNLEDRGGARNRAALSYV